MWHYKWIAREIESLDPEVEYERIMRLTYTYYANDFVMNLYYTVIFPYDIMPPHVAEAVYRRNAGKLINRRQQRADDTFKHFWQWFEHGPSSPVTQKSVAQVNAIHMNVAKSLGTGNFSHNVDFVYTLCNMACELHRLRLRIGMSGFTENQQIATSRFFTEMAKLFVSERGGVTDFPSDFATILRYCEAHESVAWESTEAGRAACEALIAQFAERWFPKRVHRLVHPVVVSLWGQAPRRVHRMPAPSPTQERLVKLGMRAFLAMQETLLPDPQISTPERARRRAARQHSITTVRQPAPDAGVGAGAAVMG